MMSSTKHTALSTKKANTRCFFGSCLVLIAYCLVLFFTSGCVTRSLTIRTDPPGALVYLNDQLKGTSPVTYDFMWYGWHRVMLRKDGFERVEDRKLLSAPFYLWVPFDLAMELLPIRFRDTHTWNYTLTQTQQPSAPVPPKIASPQVAPKVDAESKDLGVNPDTTGSRP